MREAAAAARITAAVMLAFLVESRGLRAQTPCFSSTELEREGYRVAEVQLTGPLRSESALHESLRRRGVTLPQRGERFTMTAFLEGKEQLRAALREWPTLFDSPVKITVVRAEVANCRADTREVDLDYGFATTAVPVSFTSREVNGAAARDPEQRVGLAPLRRFRLGPTVAYDRSRRLQLGARIVMVPVGTWPQLVAEGSRSPESHAARVRAEDTRSLNGGLLSQLDWRVQIDHASVPSPASDLRHSRVLGEVSVLTGPLPFGRLRIGAAVEGGDQEADDLQTVPESFVRRSGYAQLAGLVQLDRSGARHATSASYQIRLGTAGGGLDYVKHTLDLEAAAYVPFWRDRHRRFGVESRIALGSLDVIDRSPVTERFFGGSAESDEDTWREVRGPLVRSAPPFTLASADPLRAAGIDGFAALNLTLAFDVWHRPLIPEEITEDAEIRGEVASQLNSAETTLSTVYATRDPAHSTVFQNKERIVAIVEGLESAVNDVDAQIDEDEQAQLELCQSMAGELVANVADWTETTPLAAYVRAPDSEDDPTMPGVEATCGQANASLGDAAMARALAEVAQVREWIQGQLANIDVARADARAKEDMRFPRHAVNTIFDELNLVAVSPVLLFDIARVWENGRPQVKRTHYALGGGIRVTLASSFAVTFTYAADPRARSGERNSSATISMRVLNVF